MKRAFYCRGVWECVMCYYETHISHTHRSKAILIRFNKIQALCNLILLNVQLLYSCKWKVQNKDQNHYFFFFFLVMQKMEGKKIELLRYKLNNVCHFIWKIHPYVQFDPIIISQVVSINWMPSKFIRCMKFHWVIHSERWQLRKIRAPCIKEWVKIKWNGNREIKPQPKRW